MNRYGTNQQVIGLPPLFSEAMGIFVEILQLPLLTIGQRQPAAGFEVVPMKQLPTPAGQGVCRDFVPKKRYLIPNLKRKGGKVKERQLLRVLIITAVVLALGALTFFQIGCGSNSYLPFEPEKTGKDGYGDPPPNAKLGSLEQICRAGSGSFGLNSRTMEVQGAYL
jgi:hypothetical protein